MKNKPCAFCGSTEKENPRTKGHVLQRSLFPETGSGSVQRITVPECVACKAFWQDAEDEFRSFMVLAGAGSNEHANAQWDGPIARAHQREEDGIQRVDAIVRCLAPRKTPDGEELRLFPHLTRALAIGAGSLTFHPCPPVGADALHGRHDERMSLENLRGIPPQPTSRPRLRCALLDAGGASCATAASVGTCCRATASVPATAGRA